MTLSQIDLWNVPSPVFMEVWDWEYLTEVDTHAAWSDSEGMWVESYAVEVAA